MALVCEDQCAWTPSDSAFKAKFSKKSLVSFALRTLVLVTDSRPPLIAVSISSVLLVSKNGSPKSKAGAHYVNVSVQIWNIWARVATKLSKKSLPEHKLTKSKSVSNADCKSLLPLVIRRSFAWFVKVHEFTLIVWMIKI